MSKNQQLFQWLSSKFFGKKKIVNVGGAYSETPNYYVESGFQDFILAGQKTKLNLTECTSGQWWFTIGNDFSFEGYGA